MNQCVAPPIIIKPKHLKSPLALAYNTPIMHWESTQCFLTLQRSMTVGMTYSMVSNENGFNSFLPFE